MNGFSICVTVATFLVETVCLGTEFRNLGFDDGDLTHGIVDSTETARALPGWSLYLGDSKQELFRLEPFPFGDINQATLVDGRPYGDESGFALFLNIATRTSPLWRLEQTGTVPAGTRYLTYRLRQQETEARINGETIRPLNILEFPGYAIGYKTDMWYDVSKFAGQEVSLQLIGPVGEGHGWPEPTGKQSFINNIRFTTSAPKLTIAKSLQPSGPQALITFDPIPGKNVVVEFCDNLIVFIWQPLPGAPHNSGTVTDTSPSANRFYRFKITDP